MTSDEPTTKLDEFRSAEEPVFELNNNVLVPHTCRDLVYSAHSGTSPKRVSVTPFDGCINKKLMTHEEVYPTPYVSSTIPTPEVTVSERS